MMDIKEYKRKWYLANKERILKKRKKYYQENKEKAYQYAMSPARKAYRKAYNQSTAGKAVQKKAGKKKYALHTEKCKAGNLARYHIPPGICEVYGCNIDGERHHDDYNKPLNIRYLCRRHHKELHRKQRKDRA